MAMAGPSVEGPLFAEKVRRAEAITRKLQEHRWDFGAVPELINPDAMCDVAAKEMVLIHDGRMQTRIGRLVIAGVGAHFNLLGPESPMSVLKSEDTMIIEDLNRQIGSEGLYEFSQFKKLGRPQQVEFYNFSEQYQTRDLAFWGALHDTGFSPSGFEHLTRHLAAGKVMHTAIFSARLPSKDRKRPIVMQARPLHLQFPTTVVEWMDKPFYGGIMKETIHIENLLTLEPTRVAHPYLPLVAEGKVELNHQMYYLRRFAGIAQKDGVRGPNIPQEGVPR
jgi:hypothetical protein